MTDTHLTTPEEERQHHTYTTHRINWFVRAMWICYWIGLVYYIITFAIPSIKDYF